MNNSPKVNSRKANSAQMPVDWMLAMAAVLMAATVAPLILLATRLV